MNSNRIPESYQPLSILAERALEAAQLYGARIGLKQNDAEAIGTDVVRFSGRPDDPDRPDLPPINGAVYDYYQARTDHAAVRKELQAVTAEARRFCAVIVDLLKAHLGRRWNFRWQEAEFTNGSLALDRDPYSILSGLGRYLGRHPEHENAPLSVKALAAHQLAASLLHARDAAAAARGAEVDAKQARDAAMHQLRRRLTALRNELNLVLEPDDSRWHTFGFRRPADGRGPEAVKTVTARPGAERELVVEWPPARRATGYRVTWRLASPSTESEAEVHDLGLFSDQMALLEELPAGAEVIIGVSARNATGEARATEVTATVPGTTLQQHAGDGGNREGSGESNENPLFASGVKVAGESEP